MHNVCIAADTTVGLSRVEQVSRLEPLKGRNGIGGKNASAHGSAAFVLGVQRSGYPYRGWKAGQTVQVGALIGHGSFVGSFSSGHFVDVGWV